MRTRSAVVDAIVHLVTLYGVLAALNGCGNSSPAADIVRPTTPTLTGPFQVAGSVANTIGALLEGALVTVTSPAGTSRMTTGSDGRYALAAAGDVTVRAAKAGFDPQEQRLTVSHSMGLDFNLALTIPPDAYRLTFTASQSCSLPSDATPRQYWAAITEDAGRLVVNLGGATLVAFVGIAGFTGARDGNAVRFQISDDEWAPCSFIELLPGTRWLTYSGTATGRVSGDSIVATFNGTVRVVAYPAGVTDAQCQAADHRLEFVRGPH